MSKVRDLTLAEFGRKEIRLAEHEMPGLMAMREQYGASKPLKGLRVMGSLHMTVQTAVLIETLHELGADLQWCSCNIFSTQDHAAAAIAQGDAKVFAWKGETLEEYWWCTLQALSFPNGLGPQLMVDDGGDATLLIHEGVKAETAFEKDGTLPDLAKAENGEHLEILKVITQELQKDPKKWTKLAADCYGVSEETTTGVQRLRQMMEEKALLFPAVNVNDCVTKQKFDNVYGCRHSLPDGIMRATDVLIGGKSVLIFGYGDVGKGCAQAMKGAGARVYIAEVDPICALQAAMDGFHVVRLENVVGRMDIFVTCTGNKDILMVDSMRKMKQNAIVGNIGHFDNEIDMAGLLDPKNNIERQNIKPQVDRFVFAETGRGIVMLAEGRLLNLGCATGHPSFVMSCSFSNQVLAQIYLYEQRATLKKQLYLLPKKLDESVARLHLNALGAELTIMSDEQAAYIGVSVDGPYKNENYRY